MELNRRTFWAFGLLAAIWLLVVGWQTQEHLRVRQSAEADLSNRSKDIANTVSACIRGIRFRGAVLQEKLEPLLTELVYGRTNELVKSSSLLSIALLNAASEPVASAGPPVDSSQPDILQKGERWGKQTVTFINPVDLGAALTNPTVIIPPWTNSVRDPGKGPSRREAPPESRTNVNGTPPAEPPPGEAPPRESRSRDGEFRVRRPPPWLRGTDDSEYREMMEKRGVHGLVLVMSNQPVEELLRRDLWLRSLIVTLATISVLGSGIAWRNLAKSSELQLRLVRASEMNTHLREMNLAAAGLAHETRNPLNIIRGLAQMVSKQPDAPAGTVERSREIINEADKVAAQLNEFINYSRPREVRRTALSLAPLLNEVVRALSYDLDEKHIALQAKNEHLIIEADEQLLRQAIFNLLLNAVQAVPDGGQIEIVARKHNANEAVLEIRDNGPGVAPEHRTEIFKPYFTMQSKGTGLGLAIVQQIVLAHGWEIQCVPNEPQGAIFRITHLRIAG